MIRKEEEKEEEEGEEGEEITLRLLNFVEALLIDKHLIPIT